METAIDIKSWLTGYVNKNQHKVDPLNQFECAVIDSEGYIILCSSELFLVDGQWMVSMDDYMALHRGEESLKYSRPDKCPEDLIESWEESKILREYDV